MNKPVVLSPGAFGDVSGEDDHEDDVSPSTRTDSSLTSFDTKSSREEATNSTLYYRKDYIHGSRRRVSSACLECQRRRRKCTGEYPCQGCHRSETECIYDKSKDGRSKEFFQKRLAEGVRRAIELQPDECRLSERYRLSPDGGNTKTLPLKLISTTAADLDVSDIDDSMQWEQNGQEPVCMTNCAMGVCEANLPDWIPVSVWRRQSLRIQSPRHLLFPFIIEDDFPLSKMYTNFVRGAKQLLHQGATPESLLGPLDSEVDLLFRDRRASDPFSACTWACELVKIYSNLDVVTKLAQVFLFARLMRWILNPTPESFAMVPAMIKPTLSEVHVPHFASTGLHVLPAVRDALIRGEDQLPQNIGEVDDSSYIRFNWNFEIRQALQKNSTTGVITISRLLAACASDAQNWSCGRNFLAGSPAALNYTRIIHHHHGWTDFNIPVN